MSQILIDHCYANNRLALIFYDEETKQFRLWQRHTPKHLSYSYILNEDGSGDKFIEKMYEDDDFLKAYLGHENVILFHPILGRQAQFTRVYFQNPRDVTKFMGGDEYFENGVKYYTRFAIDERISFGMPYIVEDEKILPIKSKLTKKQRTLYRKLCKKFDKDMVTDTLKLLLAPVPEIPFISCDVEVLPQGNVVPNPKTATEPVISVALSFVDGNNTRGVVLALTHETRVTTPRKVPFQFIKDTRTKKYEVEWFETERSLLKRLIELLQDPEYRVLVTFNGDNFDLQYIYHRCRYFGLWTPIRYRNYVSVGGREYHDVHFEPKDPTHRTPNMRHWKLHLDLYKFFSQTYIKNYAYESAYSDNRLETISQALIGEGKTELKTPIADLSVWELITYNFQDVALLDKLIRLNNNQVICLIFLLMRLGVEPFGECHRKAISSKVQHFIQKWITRKNWVSPRRVDMRAKDNFEWERLDTDVSLLPTKYKGATVIDPIPGYYFKTEGRDFTGLYTNTIHNKNLSFETICCGHTECMTNVVPDVGHYVCTKRKGIMAEIIGLITTARTLYFKDKGKSDPFFKPTEQVLKVFGNAAYGVFGAIFFPYYLWILAESITAYSRDALERMIIKAKELGMKVIYGDTDSVFLADYTDDSMAELVKWVDKELDLELSLDYDLNIFVISHRKKNYFGIEKSGNPIVKGFKIKKRNTPPIISELGKKVINILGKATNEEELQRAKRVTTLLLRSYYNRIWNQEGKVTDYAFTQQITKKLKNYKVLTIHVRAALIEVEALIAGLPKGVAVTPEQIIQPGTLQSYVKCSLEIMRRPSGKSKRIGVLPLSMAEIKDIEPSHYHKELISSINQIVEPLGIEPKHYQTRDPNRPALDSFFPKKPRIFKSMTVEFE